MLAMIVSSCFDVLITFSGAVVSSEVKFVVYAVQRLEKLEIPAFDMPTEVMLSVL